MHLATSVFYYSVVRSQMQGGKKLKIARLLAGLKQRELAEKALVSRSLVAMIEQERRRIRPYLAARLNKILGVSFEEENLEAQASSRLNRKMRGRNGQIYF